MNDAPSRPLAQELFRELSEDRAVVLAAACVAEGYNCPNTARELRTVGEHMLDGFYPRMTTHLAEYNKLVLLLRTCALSMTAGVGLIPVTDWDSRVVRDGMLVAIEEAAKLLSDIDSRSKPQIP